MNCSIWRIRRHAVVGHVDVMVGKVLRHVLAVVELAAIHHRADAMIVVKIENIRIWPPRCRDDTLHDPGEGLRAFGLTSFRPIPRADGLRHAAWCMRGVVISRGAARDETVMEEWGGPRGCCLSQPLARRGKRQLAPMERSLRKSRHSCSLSWEATRLPTTAGHLESSH
jgi:hypothetical protein